MKISKGKLNVQMARNCIRSKQQLANIAGISYGKMKRSYSSGGTGETVGKIAKALNVDVTDIIVDN